MRWCRARSGRVLILAVVAAVALAMTADRWGPFLTTERGARLVGAGDYVSAARALSHRVVSAPSDARAHYWLGVAYARIGVREGAVRHLTRAVRLAPRDALYHDGLGRMLREAGDGEAALGEFRDAVGLAPGEPRYQADLAGLLLDRGHVEAAAAALRRAVAIRPDAVELRLLLATALGRAGDTRGMAREYREVTRRASESPLGEMARQQLHTVESSERSLR